MYLKKESSSLRESQHTSRRLQILGPAMEDIFSSSFPTNECRHTPSHRYVGSEAGAVAPLRPLSSGYHPALSLVVATLYLFTPYLFSYLHPHHSHFFVSSPAHSPSSTSHLMPPSTAECVHSAPLFFGCQAGCCLLRLLLLFGVAAGLLPRRGV